MTGESVKVKVKNLTVMTEELRRTHEVAAAMASSRSECSQCKQCLLHSSFSRNQLKPKFTDKTRRCKTCITTGATQQAAAAAASVNVAEAEAEVDTAAAAVDAAAAVAAASKAAEDKKVRLKHARRPEEEEYSSSEDDSDWEASEGPLQKAYQKQQQIQSNWSLQQEQMQTKWFAGGVQSAESVPSTTPALEKGKGKGKGKGNGKVKGNANVPPASTKSDTEKNTKQLGQMASKLLKFECPKAAFPVAVRGLQEVDTGAGAEQSFVSLLRNAKAASGYKLAEEALQMGRRDLEESSLPDFREACAQFGEAESLLDQVLDALKEQINDDFLKTTHAPELAVLLDKIVAVNVMYQPFSFFFLRGSG